MKIYAKIFIIVLLKQFNELYDKRFCGSYLYDLLPSEDDFSLKLS